MAEIAERFFWKMNPRTEEEILAHKRKFTPWLLFDDNDSDDEVSEVIRPCTPPLKA